MLRENSIDLLSKVALRSLQDFSIPLHVTVAGNRELFWKWHLLSDHETTAAIKSELFTGAPAQEQKSAVSAVPETKPAEPQQSLTSAFEEMHKDPETKPEQKITEESAPELPVHRTTIQEKIPITKAKRSYKKMISATSLLIPLAEQYFLGVRHCRPGAGNHSQECGNKFSPLRAFW